MKQSKLQLWILITHKLPKKKSKTSINDALTNFDGKNSINSCQSIFGRKKSKSFSKSDLKLFEILFPNLWTKK